MIKIILPMAPMPQKRHKSYIDGECVEIMWKGCLRKATLDAKLKSYNSIYQRRYMEEVRWRLKRQYKEAPLKDPLVVDLVFYFKRPKTVRRPVPSTKPDCTNLAKIIEDSCNGILWKDDCLIVDINTKKRYSAFADAYIVIEVKRWVDENANPFDK